MVGPGEALLRVALAAEKIGLPRAIGGDAGNFVDLGLVGNGVGGVGSCRADNEIDLIAEEQFGRDFRGAAAARLTVFGNNLAFVGLSVVFYAFAHNSARL